MTALTLGEATTMALAGIRTGRPARRGRPHRTGAAVRRDSIEAGTFEDMFFAVPAKGEPDRMLRAARAALDVGRRLKRAARVDARELSPAERPLAALTAGAVRVYEEICTLARLNGGRVFPSYDRLAQATALGRATVARALALLEAAGFLVRQRRFKRVEATGQGAGPRYAQTSNVYRPTLSAAAARLLPHWLRPAPPPADAVQRVVERNRDVAAMEATLSARCRRDATTTGTLARMLARLGAAVDAAECESQKQPQPLHHSYLNKSDRNDLDDRCIPSDGGNRPMMSMTDKITPDDMTGASASPPQCSPKGAGG